MIPLFFALLGLAALVFAARALRRMERKHGVRVTDVIEPSKQDGYDRRRARDDRTNAAPGAEGDQPEAA